MEKREKEISVNQIKKIVDIYTEFKENEYCKIFDKEEFLYREYAVYQPLQRSYGISDERIKNLKSNGYLDSFYSQEKVDELELLDPIPSKEKKQLEKYNENKKIYDNIFKVLEKNKSNTIYKNKKDFIEVIDNLFDLPKNIVEKIIDGLSIMDKTAEIQKDKNGKIIINPTTKDSELVKFTKDIKEYMKEEVLPHVPDAMEFFEENMDAKKPVIRTGAEFPFTRYFYKYNKPENSEKLEKDFLNIENSLNKKIEELFREV